MITVRMVYSGMRLENRAVDEQHAQTVLAGMFANHGITATKSNPMAGRHNLTGARVKATFIPDALVKCVDCPTELDTLDVFPGGRCIECHGANPAVQRQLATMTAGNLARMWGGR